MDIKLTNKIITKTNCVKSLGMFIDENFKWNKHIKIIEQKVSRSYFAINKAKHVLSKNILKCLQYPLEETAKEHY